MEPPKMVEAVWGLERRLRRVPVLSILLLALPSLLVWGGLTGFGPVGSAVVEATEFQLVTEGGELRGRLAVEDGEPVFELLAPDGTAAATLRTSEVATSLFLEHRSGVQDARLYVDSTGTGFDLYGANYSQLYAKIGPRRGFSFTATDPMGVPELELFRDEAGTLRARLSGRVWPGEPSP